MSRKRVPLETVSRFLHAEVFVTNPPEREIRPEVLDAMRHSTGSYELVVAAIAAAGLGFWIDSVLGIVPVFTLVFAIAGFVGAGYSIYLSYQAQMAIENADRTSRRSATGQNDHTLAMITTAASEGGARDERVSGAQRSAPTGDAVLRANATCAAKQAGKI